MEIILLLELIILEIILVLELIETTELSRNGSSFMFIANTSDLMCNRLKSVAERGFSKFVSQISQGGFGWGL